MYTRSDQPTERTKAAILDHSITAHRLGQHNSWFDAKLNASPTDIRASDDEKGSDQSMESHEDQVAHLRPPAPQQRRQGQPACCRRWQQTRPTPPGQGVTSQAAGHYPLLPTILGDERPPWRCPDRALPSSPPTHTRCTGGARDLLIDATSGCHWCRNVRRPGRQCGTQRPVFWQPMPPHDSPSPCSSEGARVPSGPRARDSPSRGHAEPKRQAEQSRWPEVVQQAAPEGGDWPYCSAGCAHPRGTARPSTPRPTHQGA
mmetsp:Transcript_133727/g.324971  ORF Transcript_133727/g.324971 Transcript_133727/m.324971 type:complete len:259 (-) Transcript_133727:294-1070(-)